jgi:hypothetical protein
VLKSTLLGIELGKQTETLPYAEAEKERLRLSARNVHFRNEIDDLNRQIKTLSDAIYANTLLIRGDTVPARYANELTAGQEPIRVDTRKKFIMACPGETCRGFLSSAYKCGLCNLYTCSECLVIKSDPHTCDENAVLTATAIKNDTKPCPQCGTRIYKIDGCDQMFCTAEIDGKVCETAFSWKTGIKETGRIHNPHYYELRRKQGNLEREVGDVPCGGIPSMVRMNRLFGMLILLPEFKRKYSMLHQQVNEIKRVFDEYEHYGIYTKHIRSNQNHDSVMRNHRVQYILNRISQDDLAEYAYRGHKEVQKNTDLHHIMEIIRISIVEMFQSMHQATPRIDDMPIELLHDDVFADQYGSSIQIKVDQLMQVRDYCNEQLKGISGIYNCTVPIFNDYCRIMPRQKFNMNGSNI